MMNDCSRDDQPALPPAHGSAIAGLQYIAESPPTEYGGFHPRTVEIAKDALTEIGRLRTALAEIAGMAEEYNYVGWQRIVGRMRRRAAEALSPNETGQARREEIKA